MSIFSYHLIELPFFKGVGRQFLNPVSKNTRGLKHFVYMSGMTLGAPVFSTKRVLLNQAAVFMQWEDEAALDAYLKNDSFGMELANGWHVRLAFMRQWGNFQGYSLPNLKAELDSPQSPVVAVTIARMKPLAIPRFIHWGRPVEKLVRDHPGTTISLATVKFPNTVSTFSIWKNQEEMTQMVHGHSKVQRPRRHKAAMEERDRKPFHFEFTTLRFKPLGEYGSWKGRNNYIPAS